MRRLHIIRLLLLFALPAAAAAKDTNFLIILADDVSPDLYGAYGQPGAARTPAVDRLAQEGVLFKTAWATAMCAPTRAEIMTGRYAQRTGVYHNEIWLDDARNRLFVDNVAFSKPLQQAGYATAVAGKWHVGSLEPYETEVGFDEYCLWSSTNKIAELSGSPEFDGAWENDETTSRYWHPAYICNNKLLDTGPLDFGPAIEADFLMDFIGRSVDDGRPFLAYWPTVAPHGTRQGMPTTPFRGEPGIIAKSDNEENRARFVALNEYLDFQVGRVIDHLDKLGVTNDTIVMFLSDNGTAVTAKTRGVERGSHVVAVMRGKHVKPRGAPKATNLMANRSSLSSRVTVTERVTGFMPIFPDHNWCALRLICSKSSIQSSTCHAAVFMRPARIDSGVVTSGPRTPKSTPTCVPFLTRFWRLIHR
jgi:arylsulfatase A-like enzyme